MKTSSYICDSMTADELECDVSTELFGYSRVIGLHEQLIMTFILTNAVGPYQRFVSCKFIGKVQEACKANDKEHRLRNSGHDTCRVKGKDIIQKDVLVPRRLMGADPISMQHVKSASAI